MNNKYFCEILLHEFKKGSNDSEVARNVNDVFGEGSVNDPQTQKRFKNFDLHKRSRSTYILDYDCQRSLIEEDLRKTIWEFAEELEVSYATVDVHLKKIEDAKKLDKWIPHKLDTCQKPQISGTTAQKQYDLGYKTLPHSAYSADLSPTDYHFFKHLDHFLRNPIFVNCDSVKHVFKQLIDSFDSDF